MNALRFEIEIHNWRRYLILRSFNWFPNSNGSSIQLAPPFNWPPHSTGSPNSNGSPIQLTSIPCWKYFTPAAGRWQISGVCRCLQGNTPANLVWMKWREKKEMWGNGERERKGENHFLSFFLFSSVSSFSFLFLSPLLRCAEWLIQQLHWETTPPLLDEMAGFL